MMSLAYVKDPIYKIRFFTSIHIQYLDFVQIVIEFGSHPWNFFYFKTIKPLIFGCGLFMLKLYSIYKCRMACL